MLIQCESVQATGKMTESSAWQFSAYNASFLKSREEWFSAMILANYSKTDEEILKKAVNDWKIAVDANVQYHEEIAKAMDTESSVIARQHRLLAAIYKEIRPTLNSD